MKVSIVLVLTLIILITGCKTLVILRLVDLLVIAFIVVGIGSIALYKGNKIIKKWLNKK